MSYETDSMDNLRRAIRNIDMQTLTNLSIQINELKPVLTRIASALEKQNEIKEKELTLKYTRK